MKSQTGYARHTHAWWMTAFWTHRAQLTASFCATLVIWTIGLGAVRLLVSSTQFVVLVEMVGPCLLVLGAGMIALAVDRDHLRIRAALSGNLLAISTYFRGGILAATATPAGIRWAETVVASRARVQRRWPAVVLLLLNYGLVVVGAALGARFATAFPLPATDGPAPPAIRLLAMVITATVALALFATARLSKHLDRTSVAQFRRLSRNPASLPADLPFDRAVFLEKFDRDLDQAIALAQTPDRSFEALDHFLRLPERDAWEPDSLLDLSYTMFLFGVGLVLGPVFALIV